MAIAVHNQNSALIPGIRRVYYSGTSTILEGMPVCYNSDRTTDMDGVTVAAGTENNGRFMDVEDPKTANLPFFAGTIKQGSYGAKTGPAWLDIYTPGSGQPMSILTDQSCTINSTFLAIKNGETVFTAVATGNLTVALAMDTIDRSGTDGLCLAKVYDAVVVTPA
jgi:hypothetical protein